MAKPVATRSDGDDKALRQRLGEIDARLEKIDATLVKDHPGFVELALPRPVAAKDLKAVLRAEEALLVYLPTEKHVYAWRFTRNETRWQRIDLPQAELVRKVRTLRCGLDASEWWEEARAKRCTELTGGKASESVLPFDALTSVELHKALIAPVAASLEGKHILLVAGGALSSLPLQVLMPEVPKDGGLAKAKWLGLRHAMTTLPSIGSLRSLRREARGSSAQRPYFGVGNPLLIGPNREYSAAWGAQSCLASSLRKQRAAGALAAVSDARSRGALVRGGAVDVEQVRLLSPLPETRDEICGVLSSTGGGEQDLAMGSKASERNLRDLNAGGALRNYRVLHFATHGLIAGEVPGLTEAALVLTPPAEAKPDDDGLLTASEIATFKLDADWVILSACNTAAGDSLGAETLSGLARAFFHAGARSLLVSHWPVQSDAAVKLTTRALAELRKSPGLARAEALRRAMVALVAGASVPGSAHPQVWAPFVVAGEGGGSLTAMPAAAVASPAAAPAPMRTEAASEIVPAAAVAAGAAAGAAAASGKSGEGKPWVPPWLKKQAAPAPAAKAPPAPAAATPAAVPKTVPAAGPSVAAPAKPAAPVVPASKAPPTPNGIKPLPPTAPAAAGPPSAAQAAPAAAAVTAPKAPAQKSLTDSLFR